MKNNKFSFALIFLLIVLIIFLSFSVFSLKKSNDSYQKQILEYSLINEKKKEKKISKDDTSYENKNPNILTRQILFFSKENFKTEFKNENSSLIFDELTDPMTWESLNFSISNSEDISKTLKSSPEKTSNIINQMIKYDKELKLILVPKEDKLIVNYGSNHDEKESTKEILGTKQANNHRVKNMEIEIDYNNKNVELQYFLTKDKLAKSSLEDDINERYLYGDDIQAFIEDNILVLNFPMTRDLAIDETITALALNKNYSRFKVYVEYTDGEKFDYELKNK